MKNSKAETCNSFYVLVLKEWRELLISQIPPWGYSEIYLSRVVVITYFLFCPRFFPILKFLKLPSNLMQKSSFPWQASPDCLISSFLALLIIIHYWKEIRRTKWDLEWHSRIISTSCSLISPLFLLKYVLLTSKKFFRTLFCFPGFIQLDLAMVSLLRFSFFTA